MMWKRLPALKATTVLILCGVIILVCFSLYHSIPIMSNYGMTATFKIVIDVHQSNNNESLKEVHASTEKQKIRPPPLSILPSSKSSNKNYSRYDSASGRAVMGEATASSVDATSTNSSSITPSRNTSWTNVSSLPLLPLTNDNNDSQITDPITSTAAAINNSTTETKGSLVIDQAFNELQIITSSFFVNYIMRTQPPVHANCHRTCVDFRNKIFLSTQSLHTGAGLIDRLTIFSTMLNMAGYLCARLYVPRPKFMLVAKHNYNRELEINVTWSEFGTFVLWNDPKQQNALIDWDNPNNVEELPILATLQEDEPADFFQFAWLPRQVKYQFPSIEQYVFTQQQQLQQQQLAVTVANNNNSQTNNVNHTNRFIWRIEANSFFEWATLIANHLRRRPLPKHYHNQGRELDKLKEPFIFGEECLYFGCQYAKVEPARHLQELQEKIVKQILQQPSDDTTFPSLLPPIIGYFHVRRQDAITECKTDLKRIKAFLTCSLGKAISQLSNVPSVSSNTTSYSQSIKVLFSSDEVDQEYRRNVIKFIEKQQSHYYSRKKANNHHHLIQVMAIDLDHLVDETIRAEVENGRIPSWRQNNFYAFQFVFSIGFNQSVVHFHMEQRRADCK